MDYSASMPSTEPIVDDKTTQINCRPSIPINNNNNLLSQSSLISTDSDQSDDDDFSIFELAVALNEVSEDLLLAQYGYSKKENISKTLQGELFVAVNKNNENNTSVAVKKISKNLYLKRESIDIDGFTFIVNKDIVKEASILSHLTMDNQCIGDSIVKYIDFFQSETDYYLVMEYIENNMNLKDFVIKSHEFIRAGKLKRKSYQNMIKYLMWQFAATIHWLHNDMNCCHLDLCPENIMVKNGEFMVNSDGTVSINPQIELKLVDLGVSELFDISFKCNKEYLSLDNEQYLSPNISNNEYYDARASDMWSFGMIIYYCFMGIYPFKFKEETDSKQPTPGTAYWSICNGKLKQYLGMNNLLKFINPKILSVLNGLLNIDEKKRFNSMNLLQHKWFNCYYKKYASQISKKSIKQKEELLLQQNEISLLNIYYGSI